MADSYYHEPPIAEVSETMLRLALATPRLYGDGFPLIDTIPPTETVARLRIQRAALFRRNFISDIAETLEGCASNQRCFSGACPECGRAFQRFLVSSGSRLLKPPSDFVTASLVPTSDIPPRSLCALNFDAFRRQMFGRLHTSHLAMAIGGFDFSLNLHRNGEFQPHWSPHMWLLANVNDEISWERHLRRSFERSEAVVIPKRIERWDGRPNAIAYSLKATFHRRITEQRLRRANGRLSQGTNDDRLRSRERLELLTYLHQIGLGARVILIGIDTTFWPHLKPADFSEAT